MQNLPRIFDAKGVFVEPDRAPLPPDVVKQLDRVRDTYMAVSQQERIVGGAQEEITAALSEVAAAEKLVKPFGPYNFMSLWRETIRGQ